VYRHIKGSVGFYRASNALKPDSRCTRLDPFGFRLHINVREHTVGDRFFHTKSRDDGEEGLLNSGYRFVVAGDRIGSQYQVAHTVGPRVKDLPRDVDRVISW